MTRLEEMKKSEKVLRHSKEEEDVNERRDNERSDT